MNTFKTTSQQLFVLLGLLLLIDTVTLRAGIIANTYDFSGIQGTKYWSYGYLKSTPDGKLDAYRPDKDFIPFNGGEGAGDWNGTTQQWTGSEWKLLAQSNEPEMIISKGIAQPGLNYWNVSRWKADELTEMSPVQIRTILIKSDTSCGNGLTCRIYINGELRDEVIVSAGNKTRINRLFYAFLNPGDILDFVMTPFGEDGRDNNECDQVNFQASVNTTINITDPAQPNGKSFLASLPTPQLEIHSVQPPSAGTATTVKWKSLIGGTYDIECTSDFKNWTKLATGLKGASNSSHTTWNDASSQTAGKTRIYRVVEGSRSFEGLWVGWYENKSYQLVQITRNGDEFVGTKILGGINVTVGNVTFRFNPETKKAVTTVADEGFVDPEILPSNFIYIDPDRITITIPSRNQSTPLRRVH